MTMPDQEPDDSASAAPPGPAEPSPFAAWFEAIRAFIIQVGSDVRTSLVRTLAAYASLVLLSLVIIAAGMAMAATGAVLVVHGVAGVAAAWLGSVAAGQCLAGVVFLLIPLAGAWLAYRAWRQR